MGREPTVVERAKAAARERMIERMTGGGPPGQESLKERLRVLEKQRKAREAKEKEKRAKEKARKEQEKKLREDYSPDGVFNYYQFQQESRRGD